VKEKSCVYIIPPFQIFNKENFPIFENFSNDFSQQLFMALYLNFFELFPNDIKFNATHILPGCDMDFIPEELKSPENNFYFVEPFYKENIITTLKEKFFPRFTANLVIYSDIIGITKKDIDTVFNLLNDEDNHLEIGKTVENSIGYIGFNSYQESIHELFNTTITGFEDLLKDICKVNSNIHIFEVGRKIKNMADFKELYKILSSKDSFAFCSQKIHEMFTNIFIEYKELL
jgi:hypothetical protein